jgi:non-ribosomal peptide synthetase-like protein
MFGSDYLYYLPLAAWPTAMMLIVVTVGLMVAIRWIVLPSVKAGTYSVYSGFFFRKWIVSLCTELTLDTLSSLYATVYMRFWYRLMGAKIGRDAEISTNLSGRYDLVEIGDHCFIADEVMLGEEACELGWIHLEKVTLGAHVFVGNDAVVPAGAHIPSGTLIGISSATPDNALMEKPGIWFGSPPIAFPVRQEFKDIGSNWTFNPPRWKRIARGVFEAFSVSFPTMLFITFGNYAVEALAPAILARDLGQVIPQFMAASSLVSIGLMLSAALMKWVLMGVYKPTVNPMWSWWALRTEAIAVLYWGLAGKVILDHLRGTAFLPWGMRLFGAKIGKGVFMDTTDITEFDCVTVGDWCVINAGSALQTHLYEDRVMKVGRVHLGDGITVGSNSAVLYDTSVGDFARVGPLTVIMKGESLPAHSAWQGLPAQTVIVTPTDPLLAPAALPSAFITVESVSIQGAVQQAYKQAS